MKISNINEWLAQREPTSELRIQQMNEAWHHRKHVAECKTNYDAALARGVDSVTAATRYLPVGFY